MTFSKAFASCTKTPGPPVSSIFGGILIDIFRAGRRDFRFFVESGRKGRKNTAEVRVEFGWGTGNSTREIQSEKEGVQGSRFG